MNPITIEQTCEDMALAFEVHRNAAICGIRLRRSRLAGRFPDEAPKGPIVVKFTARSRNVEAAKGKLRVEVDFRMSGEVEARPGAKVAKREPPLVTVDCTYVVDYELQEGFEPPPANVKAFKDGNVVFNCWPYFREYLQASIQRMGFPPITAPFLRVQPKPPKVPRKAGKKPIQD